MNSLIATLKVLGDNFYLAPTEQNQSIRDELSQLIDWINWPDENQIIKWLQEMSLYSYQDLKYPFSILFEGQGAMECPPWGSVYLEPSNIVFGDSTTTYRHFLKEQNLELDLQMKEPEDQFGLMLLALCQLLLWDKQSAAIELLTKHLLPWSDRYLTLLSLNEYSQFYSNLAKITQLLLNELKIEFEINIDDKKLYL